MAITNVLLLAQIAGYVIELIMSLCIVVPMSLQQAELDGQCLLFSEGLWADRRMYVTWASPVRCHYVLFVGVVIMIVSLTQIYRLLLVWYEGRESSFLYTFLESVGCMVLCGLVFSAGTIVTLGFMSWCNSVSQWFPSCEDLAGHEIYGISTDSTEYFYLEISTAQFGAWAAFSTFVGLAVASTLKFLRYHQLQNIHAVMSREHDDERQPLLNSGWPEHGHSTHPAQEA